MKRTRILVLGKSFPEPDNREMETICTIGCTTAGKLIRLYPVPLRYLPNHIHYRPHDWITAPIARSTQDTRAETYNVMSKEISLDGRMIPNRGWVNLERYVFADAQWHYRNLEALQSAQKSRRVSVGFIKVDCVKNIAIVPRLEEERALHEAKIDQLQQQQLLTAASAGLLAFQPYRIVVHWTAPDDHVVYETEICSWKVLRQVGKVSEATADRHVRKLLDTEIHDLGFIMASFKDNPQFKVIGLWHPKKKDVLLYKSQLTLF